MARARAPHRRTAPFGFRLAAFVAMAMATLGVVTRAKAQGGPPAPFGDARVHVDPTPTRAVALVITVITPDAEPPTFRERVSSWFNDGMRVSVGVATDLAPERIFAASSEAMKVWVVLLSPERAAVMFSVAAGNEPARYLLREVRLVSGFDELGLERLASVIHSAIVALREGAEGAERPQVEKELVEAGLLPSAPTAQPAVVGVELTAIPAPASEHAPSAVAADSGNGGAAREARASALLLAGYALRLRGAEGLGHGPLLAAGARVPSASSAFVALVSANWLLRSDFEAGALMASVQTSALRAHVGLEPRLSSRVRLQALLGAGADLAQIDSQVATDSSVEEIRPRAAGSQWRGALELTLGLWWRTRSIDWGALAFATFLPGDVHYSVRSAGVERRVVAPWPVEPGLSLQARLRSGPDPTPRRLDT